MPAPAGRSLRARGRNGTVVAMRALLPLLLLASPALAAERSVGIGTVDRLRVDGPFDVRVVPGSPRLTITGGRDAIEAVEARVDGRTLVVRPGAGAWGARDGGDGPVTVTLGTAALASVVSIAGARITVAAAKGDRVDLSVSGAGAITVADATAADLVATVIGTGTIAVAGRTPRARLVVNGPGAIDAGRLDAGDVTAHLDGAGTIGARARYTAGGSNSGLGTIAVAGGAKCTFRSPAGGRVDCGAP